MQPLVSIIIPTYNARPWLKEAIGSALAQTYPRCEVIVVDDGSTDGTGEWLAKEYDNQVKYIYKSNGGLGSARNVGLSSAGGEFIQFLDADDLIVPEKVATHVAYLLEHPETDAVYGHILCFYDGRSDQQFDWPREHRYCSGNIFASMLQGGFLLPHALLSRKTCLDRVHGFDETLTSCVDWDYWLRVAWAGASFSYLPGPAVGYYRVRAGQMSESRPGHALNGLRVLTKVAGYVNSPQELRRLGLSQARGHWRFRYGKALAEAGQLRRGLYEMTRGALADRRDLDYKLSFMALALLAGPRRAAGAQARLKRAKDRLMRRRASSGSSQVGEQSPAQPV